MKGYNINPVTPQQKMVAVNNRFGNTNIAQQQGTTRVIYDSLPLDGRTNFRFFENANTMHISVVCKNMHKMNNSHM